METYNFRVFQAAGLGKKFVQDNQSTSRRNVLRGLHYQVKYPQGKLVHVVEGEVFDVAVDLRKDSLTYRCWVGVNLSSVNQKQFYIPEGLAHGFVVLSHVAVLAYKCTNFYYPQYEAGLRWDDPMVGIKWPIASENIILSAKDRSLPFLT